MVANVVVKADVGIKSIIIADVRLFLHWCNATDVISVSYNKLHDSFINIALVEVNAKVCGVFSLKFPFAKYIFCFHLHFFFIVLFFLSIIDDSKDYICTSASMTYSSSSFYYRQTRHFIYLICPSLVIDHVLVPQNVLENILYLFLSSFSE